MTLTSQQIAWLHEKVQRIEFRPKVERCECPITEGNSYRMARVVHSSECNHPKHYR